MTDTTARRCTSIPMGYYDVQSHTQANKKYSVMLTASGFNTCNCIAFAMKRNKLGGNSAIGTPECTCKHIEALKSKPGCGWTSLTDEPAHLGIVCPRCYADTVLYDTRDPQTINLEDLMEDFKRLRSRLASK